VPVPIATSAYDNAATPGDAPPRRALVTGGAQRLGREIALAMARAGWDIAVHFGRSQHEALATVADIRALGRRSVAVQADLADRVELPEGVLPRADELQQLGDLIRCGGLPACPDGRE
jgi:NAD(P)-dependent dehydrogenase (short-subunit alcohol dehydrogenase family)